jgi:hypothetical protein
MAYIGTYTTTAQIRFALGVAEAELSDAEITASGIEQDLTLELVDWLPAGQNTDTIYSEGTASAATSAQLQSFYSLSNYLRYYAAYLIATTGILKFAKKISDKSNDFERNAWDDEKLQAQLLGRANAAKNQFLEVIGDTPTAAETTWMGASAPDYDPITNTTA